MTTHSGLHTDFISQLFTGIRSSKLSPLFHRNQVIPEGQFGFREKHGTVEQANQTHNEVRKAFQFNENISPAIFLGIAHAFDKVWHRGLLHKICFFNFIIY